MVEPWRIELFGGLTARQGQEEISRFRTRKTGALLAYLALRGGKPVPREVLLDVLWPESDLSAARNSLSVALSSLRALLEDPATTPGSSPLGGVLIADRTMVRLNPEAFFTDVSAFEGALRQAGDDPALLAQAIDLYRGELLTGFYDDWALEERDRLEATHQEARGRLDACHATSLKPPPPTTHSAPPALSAGGALPLLFTRFFGRTEEKIQIAALLADSGIRLLTLTGSGGVGKTRLALKVMSEAQETFSEGGVWFVPLLPVTEPMLLLDAVRDSLRLPRRAGEEALDQIAAHLSERPALLVLDNLEHLLGRGSLDPDGAAAAVRALSQRLPQAKFLLTSRQALGLDGEEELPLSPLTVPGDAGLPPDQLLEFASVRLFADRARSRRPDFQVTPRNAEAVAALVARLEGIPLALELAAAWSGLLVPAQMLERLSQRSDLLVSRRKGVPERHRTLRAAMEWGFDLLPPDARRLLAALSVFRGSFGAGAAEAVCEGEGGVLPPGRTLECLSLLRSASFLVAEEGAAEMRFSLLETVREFASERLAPEERALLERRHAQRFCEFANEESNRSVIGADAIAKYDAIEADLPNYRAALERFDGDELGLKIAGSLGYFWKTRGYFREGIAWIDRVLARAPAPRGDAETILRAWALKGRGLLSEEITDFPAAHHFYKESAALYHSVGDEESLALIAQNRGNIAYRQADLLAARRFYNEALETFRRRGTAWGIASAIGNLANISQDEGKFEEARRQQEECLRLARENGDLRMAAYTLYNLGNLAMAESDLPRARRFYEESLPELYALGDRRAIGRLQNSLGFLEMQDGNVDTAEGFFQKALVVLRDLDSRYDIVFSLEGFGGHARRVGRPERAVLLWAAAAAAREAHGTPREPEEEMSLAEEIAAAREALSPAAFEKAWAAGGALSLEDAARAALDGL